MKNKKPTIAYLSFDEWKEKYKPVLNPLHFQNNRFRELFGTNGPERSYVEKIHESAPLTIWTLSTQETISNGLSYGLDRDGFFITEIPFEEGDVIQVDDIPLPQDNDAHGVGLIATIISDHYCSMLYNVMNTGYISTIEKITELAELFYEENKFRDWEQYLEEYDECWDDFIIRWAGEMLSVEFGKSFKLSEPVTAKNDLQKLTARIKVLESELDDEDVNGHIWYAKFLRLINGEENA